MTIRETIEEASINSETRHKKISIKVVQSFVCIFENSLASYSSEKK